MSAYQNHHQELFNELALHIRQTGFFSSDEFSDAEFIRKLDCLSENILATDDDGQVGQWFIGRVLSHYPQLMDQIPRALLWFFGGNCLHYLGDEEVAHFQKLEETYFELEQDGKPLDIEKLLASLRNTTHH